MAPAVDGDGSVVAELRADPGEAPAAAVARRAGEAAAEHVQERDRLGQQRQGAQVRADSAQQPTGGGRREAQPRKAAETHALLRDGPAEAARSTTTGVARSSVCALVAFEAGRSKTAKRRREGQEVAGCSRAASDECRRRAHPWRSTRECSRHSPVASFSRALSPSSFAVVQWSALPLRTACRNGRRASAAAAAQASAATDTTKPLRCVKVICGGEARRRRRPFPTTEYLNLNPAAELADWLRGHCSSVRRRGACLFAEKKRRVPPRARLDAQAGLLLEVRPENVDRLHRLAICLAGHVEVAVAPGPHGEHLPRALLERLRAAADVVVEEVVDAAGEGWDAGGLGGDGRGEQG